MTLSKDRFNKEIEHFHNKYSDKWKLLSQINQFNTQKYLKMTSMHQDGLLEIQSYIIYSNSYQVPVLFFLPMIIEEDSTKFANLDEMKEYLSSDDVGSISLAVIIIIIIIHALEYIFMFLI